MPPDHIINTTPPRTRRPLPRAMTALKNGQPRVGFQQQNQESRNVGDYRTTELTDEKLVDPKETAVSKHKSERSRTGTDSPVHAKLIQSAKTKISAVNAFKGMVL